MKSLERKNSTKKNQGKRNIYLNLHNNKLILNKFNQEIIVSAVKQGNIDDFSHQKTLRSHACAFWGFF